jgi:energy-converting hydrogenase Eha subunit A
VRSFWISLALALALISLVMLILVLAVPSWKWMHERLIHGFTMANFLTPVLLLGIFVLFITALCLGTGYSWILPSIVTVFSGAIAILIYINSRDPTLPRGTDLPVVVLSFLALLVAAVALVAGRRIEKLFDLEDRLDGVTSQTVTSAELMFSFLPDFTESHQIPDRDSVVLRQMSELLLT